MSIGKTYKYGTVQGIPIEKIKPSPFQVRVHYGKISELAQDIKKNGLLQPVLIRPVGEFFEVVHGHRRYTAVKSLGITYISSFIKELTDVEAIRIQGSENLQRKQYDPIEEATLYKHYREYWLKEKHELLTCKKIAGDFNSTESNVLQKLGLLDLPVNVQQKIINEDIPVGKAMALIKLTTADNLPQAQHVDADRFEAGPQKERTERYFFEIERLADEIEKGDKGGLRTVKGIRDATDGILEGKSFNIALSNAKIKESLEIARKQANKGRKPEDIISEIVQAQQDPEVVTARFFDMEITMLVKKLETGAIKCPHCGGTHCLEWGCCEERVLKNDTDN